MGNKYHGTNFNRPNPFMEQSVANCRDYFVLVKRMQETKRPRFIFVHHRRASL